MPVFQNLSKNPKVAHNACYVTSLYNYKELVQGLPISQEELDSFWDVAKSKGIIDSDPNSETFLEIKDPQALVDLMELPLTYIDGHQDASIDIPDNVYAIGAYHWEITHFLVLRQNKSIWLDPIYGGSLTAKNGALQSMRFYAQKS